MAGDRYTPVGEIVESSHFGLLVLSHQILGETTPKPAAVFDAQIRSASNCCAHMSTCA